MPSILKALFYFFPRNSNTILIIKNDGIGDYILFRNYLEVIKKSTKYQDSKIYLLCGLSSKQLAEHFDASLIEEFYWYTQDSFLKWSLIRLIFSLQKIRVNTIFYPNYSRNFPVDWIVDKVNAFEKIGVDGDLTNVSINLKRKADQFYTYLLPVTHKPMHEFYRNGQIIELFTGQKNCLDVPVIEKQLLNLKEHKNIVVFQGANDNSRRWSTENFNKICKLLTTRLKMNIILAGGPEDVNAGHEIAIGQDATLFSNETGLHNIIDLCSLIAGSSLLISNDTVAIHIAAALSIPAVCICKGDLFGRFVPYPSSIPNRIKCVFPPKFDFSDGDYNKFAPKRLNEISCDKVYEVVKDILFENDLIS